MRTVGQVADEISKLRSKITVLEGMISYLSVNYTVAEEGKVPAEMFFTRADGAAVSEDHVKETIADLISYSDNLRRSLDELEELPIQQARDSNGKKPKKEKADVSQSRSPHNATPRQSTGRGVRSSS